MNLSQSFIAWLASRFKVPRSAIDMFSAANAIGGLNKSTLPTELIPLNSMQLARGLLNFTVIQGALDWVLPYWAQRQYDPDDPAFVPRSHLGLSVNITHRNWTAVGNTESPVEPIVDPRGLVMPFPGSWSLDTWVYVDDEAYFPSRLNEVRQRLVDDVPVVETSFQAGPVSVVLTTYTQAERLYHSVGVRSTLARSAVRLGLAIRPFNPEGVSLLHRIAIRESGRRVIVDGTHALQFSRNPCGWRLSRFVDGDAAKGFASGDRPQQHPDAVECGTGLATGVFVFDLHPAPGIPESVTCVVAESGRMPAVPHAPVESVIRGWHDLLNAGTQFEIPEPHLARLVRASTGTILMLADGPSITPGPFTYHQFWFRDAAYMLLALERSGFSATARTVIQSFPRHQEASGYFRSQQGEWDSNGQAIWSVWQYSLYAHDLTLASSLYVSMRDAVGWIEAARHPAPGEEGRAQAGLLPAGLSAEHLGLADFYYWDNFWAIAGIEAFIRLAELLGYPDDAERSRAAVASYRKVLESSIVHAQARAMTTALPAGPLRGVDCGMIGSCAAWYPLQLFPADDPRLAETLSLISGKYLREGLFFQHFIHSGMNPYLSLHLAQCALYAGDRETFGAMLDAVARKASPTMTYPEAIHPATYGGAMGDGHHGWAAAEVTLAVRGAFVFEDWSRPDKGHELVFLAGIPRSWFEGNRNFGIRNAPVPEGTVAIEVEPAASGATIRLTWSGRGVVPRGRWRIRLPFRPAEFRLEGIALHPANTGDGETDLLLPEAREPGGLVLSYARTKADTFPPGG